MLNYSVRALNGACAFAEWCLRLSASRFHYPAKKSEGTGKIETDRTQRDREQRTSCILQAYSYGRHHYMCHCCLKHAHKMSKSLKKKSFKVAVWYFCFTSITKQTCRNEFVHLIMPSISHWSVKLIAPPQTHTMNQWEFSVSFRTWDKHGKLRAQQHIIYYIKSY